MFEGSSKQAENYLMRWDITKHSDFFTKASPAHIEQKASLIWFNKRPTFFMDQSYDLLIHKMLHLGPPWLLTADVVRKLSHLRFLSVRLHRLVLEELNRQARFCVPFCSWSTHAQNHQFINHLSFKEQKAHKIWLTVFSRNKTISTTSYSSWISKTWLSWGTALRESSGLDGSGSQSNTAQANQSLISIKTKSSVVKS